MNSALGIKLLAGGADEQDALGVIETRVAGMPSLLSVTEQNQIEQSAANAAITTLRGNIRATANAQIRTPAFIDNVIADLKRSETARLTPIVKADILNGLQAELEPTVKAAVSAKVRKEVMSEKDKVLKTLHVALIQKHKADLLPAMNAKLATTVPQAISSAKFTAEVQAAQLELKEKLKEE